VLDIFTDLAAGLLQRGTHVLGVLRVWLREGYRGGTRAGSIAGLAAGWLQKGTHVLGALRACQRDGYREEHTCWVYCGCGSWMASERNTRAGHIAGLTAGWLQIKTDVLAIMRVWQRDG
jgi:ABC-type uncharacterized transport system permease subunit